MVLAGYADDSTKYFNATAFIVTIYLRRNEHGRDWEASLLEYLKEYEEHSDNWSDISYSLERSVIDEVLTIGNHDFIPVFVIINLFVALVICVALPWLAGHSAAQRRPPGGHVLRLHLWYRSECSSRGDMSPLGANLWD